jgi:hypothetical protein
MGSTKDPKKSKDYKETNRRRIEVKTRAYKANIKKPRYLILYYKNSILEPILNR